MPFDWQFSQAQTFKRLSPAKSYFPETTRAKRLQSYFEPIPVATPVAAIKQAGG